MNNNKQQQFIVGMILMVSACFCSATAGTLVKVISGSPPVIEILFITYALCTIFQLLTFDKQKISTIFTTKHLSLHIFRSLGGVGFYGLFFISVLYINILSAVVLRSTAPLWLPILSSIFLKQKINKVLYLPLILGFLGVAVFVHPRVETFNLGYVLSLLSGLSLAISTIFTRKLHIAKEQTHRIILLSFLIPTILFLPFSAYYWTPLNNTELYFLIGISICSFFAIRLIIEVYKYTDVVSIAPFSNFSILFAGFYDWFFWHTLPSYYTLVGLFMIISACYLTIKYNTKVAVIK